MTEKKFHKVLLLSSHIIITVDLRFNDMPKYIVKSNFSSHNLLI